MEVIYQDIEAAHERIKAAAKRTPVLTWYYLRELNAADADSRERWAERAASLDAAIVPGLLANLEQPLPR